MIPRIRWFIFLALLCFPLNTEGGYGRSGQLAGQVFLNEGNFREPFSVDVDSVSAVQVYEAGLSGFTERTVRIQNTNVSFNVYCGTHSAVIASSGPRFLLPPIPALFETNAIYDIYCIADPLAGGSQVELLGEILYDTKD